MRLLLALSSVAMLSLSAGACGSAPERTRPDSRSSSVLTAVSSPTASIASHIKTTGHYVKGDNDSDETNHKDEDDHSIHNYGRAASAVDKQKIRALVENYYAVATARKGVRACSLIYSGLAKSSTLGEAAEVAYPPAPGVPPLRGKSCAQITSLLFIEDHQQLATDAATVQVTAVRVKGNYGLALLGFKTMPERQFPVQRERGTWKIDALLDRELP
jgi:hypothetical protein